MREPTTQERLAILAGWTLINTDPVYRSLRAIKPDGRLWGYSPPGYSKYQGRMLIPAFKTPDDLLPLMGKILGDYNLKHKYLSGYEIVGGQAGNESLARGATFCETATTAILKKE